MTSSLANEGVGLENYIIHKEKLLAQALSCLSEEEFRDLIPPELKDLPLEDIKLQCLLVLQNMSNEEILKVLQSSGIDASLPKSSRVSSRSQPLSSASTIERDRERPFGSTNLKIHGEEAEKNSLTHLDILELKLRAKAIRSMLKREDEDTPAQHIRKKPHLEEAERQQKKTYNMERVVATSKVFMTLKKKLRSDKIRSIPCPPP